MKHPLFLAALCSCIFLAAFVSSCGNKKSMASGINLEVVKAKRESQIAGVYSNLKGTVTYSVELKGKLKESTQFTHILVDSIQIPISMLRFNGQDLLVNGDGTSFVMGKAEQLLLSASRRLYNNQAPKVVEETIYELSGQQIEQGLKIRYLQGTTEGFLAVDSLEIVRPIYAP